MIEQRMGRGMGLVSLAIGLTEVAATRQVRRAMGIHNGQNTGILRVLGVREIMHGIDLLSHEDPTPGIWARVAGDLLDGAVLGMAAKQTRNTKGFMTVCAAVLPVVLLDMVLAPRLSKQKREAQHSWW